MGNQSYRTKPLLDFKTKGDLSIVCKYGSCSVTGWRLTQEDRVQCILNYYKDSSFFAIYDGHGGHKNAEYLKMFFHEELKKFLEYLEDVELALQISFLSVDTELRGISSKKINSIIGEKDIEFKVKSGKQKTKGCKDKPDPDDPLLCFIKNETLNILRRKCALSDKEDSSEDDEDSSAENENGSKEPISRNKIKLSKSVGYQTGSTATIVLVFTKLVYVANVGDTRCVISKKSIAYDISIDHVPTDKVECERITKCGFEVDEDGRVNSINLSRAFGDFFLKTNDISEIENPIICDPHISIIPIDEEIDFIVVASDGLWNCLSNEEVVDYINIRLKDPAATIEDICAELCYMCIASSTEEESTDNISIIIILLNEQLKNEIKNVTSM